MYVTVRITCSRNRRRAKAADSELNSQQSLRSFAHLIYNDKRRLELENAPMAHFLVVFYHLHENIRWNLHIPSSSGQGFFLALLLFVEQLVLS